MSPPPPAPCSCPSFLRLSDQLEDTPVIELTGPSEQAINPSRGKAATSMKRADGRADDRRNRIVILGVVDRAYDRLLRLIGVAREDVECRRNRLQKECPGVPAVACLTNDELLDAFAARARPLEGEVQLRPRILRPPLEAGRYRGAASPRAEDGD